MNRPKGTKDIFGKKEKIRNFIIENIKNIAKIYNFQRIETPIFERSEIYKKSIGETSDIVSKEMYIFKDKKNRSMTLRPEGTAGTLRAIVENKLANNIGNNSLKLYYLGPMFRYENPQKGRQRQFTQFGVEMISERSPYIDAEVILMANSILKIFNIKNQLLINSLGDEETIKKYSQELKKYFEKHKKKLSKNSLKRLDTNPLRILDDKEDSKKEFVKKAPKISKFYTQNTKKYFETLTSFLKIMKINFKIDHSLVRGLDYYTDIAFEFVSQSKNVGAKDTIIGGGRYQNLLKKFNGPNKSGIGFGIGIERLINDFEQNTQDEQFKNKIDAYVLNIAPESQETVLGLVYMLRTAGFIVEWNQKPTKLTKAFALADKLNANYKIIAGAKELNKGKVAIKHQGIQNIVDITKLIDYLKNHGEKNEKN